MTQTSLLMPQELFDRLKAAAYERRTSMAALIRLGIVRILAPTKKKK